MKLVNINKTLFPYDNIYHAELELNQVSFPFTGRIEAQTPLKGDGFVGEVGMILVVDKWADTPAVRPMTGDDTATSIFALNYSTELVYDERKTALRYFSQKKAASDSKYDWLGYGEKDDIYPRMGILSVGERFTTSAINVAGFTASEAEDADPVADQFKTYLASDDCTVANGKYLCAGIDGYWTETTTPTTAIGPVVRILDNTIGMADGSFGFKLEVVKA